AGTYLLTEAEFDTPYVIVVARVLADPNDAEDLKAANALQDKVKIITDSAKPYSHPDYDRESYAETYKLLLGLAKGLPDAQRTFGKKDEVSQIRHLLGTAAGWGGLPVYEAFYITRSERCRAGDFQLTVKDVPVDAFWSISIYNKAGYFEENKFNSYSINSVTAKPDEDGSVTVNFGTKPDGMDNFLYVIDGCSYVIRLYQPHDEVLNGQWTFPEIQPIYYDD
ncbi:MAG: DUF1214 domain-containing protein, partial [Arenicella sp.]|nr:DUF1214 domain-containing protein [Arenicella sp.]